MRTKWIIVLGFCLTTCLRAALADEWSQFRGPNGSGVVSATSIPTEWSTDKNVQWKTKIPGVAWSSPIVWGDKVFVTTAITENQRKPQAGGGFGGFGGGPGGGGGGPGGPGGGGPGRGRSGGFGAMPQPGQILPQFLQDRLSLSDKQKKQLVELQKDVDAKLEKNLTDEQRKQLKELREGGGGRGGDGVGGAGGRGGLGSFGRFSQPGQILSAAIQERLNLSDKHKKQHEELQKDVDDRLAKLLNDEQNKQLKEMREMFGRGGPGGGRGGFGGGGSPPNAIYRWEVLCLDRATGSVLWRELALEGKPRIPTHGSNTYASETPVTDGERVYAYFGMHGLFCFSADGKLVWKKDLGSFPMQMGWGSSSSPVLDSDRLFLQIDNEEKSFLVSLDKKTGNEVWRVDRAERTNWGSPIVWKNKVRSELVTSGSQKIRSYDPATGKLLWELSSGGQCNATPVGDADLLYVGCETRGFGGEPGEPGGAGGRGGGRGGFGGGGGAPGGLFAVRAGASGDITLKEGETSNSGVAWSVPRSGPEKSSPLVYQGHVYILRQGGGIVTCYDAKTGKQVYRERIPNAGAFWASPWGSDGKIFCLDGDGTTHVLQAGAIFKVLGKNPREEMTWATPAIAGGAIFVRGVDHLYSIK
jgi:outer membrane protein assembly factor BamB